MNTQPKPTTPTWKEICEDKIPKPRKEDAASPTGEWTPEYVARLMDCVAPELKLARMHNAALAAERVQLEAWHSAFEARITRLEGELKK